mgnify:CR=1 FL=1
MAVKQESMVALFGAAKTEEFLWAMKDGVKENTRPRLRMYKRWLRTQGMPSGLRY